MNCTAVSRSGVCASVLPFKSQLRRISHVISSRPAVCTVKASLKQHVQQGDQQQQQLGTGVDAVSLSVAGLLLQPFAAWADEAVVSSPEAQTAVEAAADNSVAAPAWLGYVILASPLILYAIFNVYRSQVNPRIKFTDFLFIVAGVAVVANLVSILAFKIRLF